MADTKECYFCGKPFEYYGFAFTAVSLPASEKNTWKDAWKSEIVGSYDEKRFNTCSKCYTKIIKFLKELKKEK